MESVDTFLFLMYFQDLGPTRERPEAIIGVFVEILCSPGGTHGVTGGIWSVPGGYSGALEAILGGPESVCAISGGTLGSPGESQISL